MLTEKEADQLAKLLKKMTWPVPKSVFHSLFEVVISVPIELAVFDRDGRVLMVYREDSEFTGWHLPGTVMRDSDTVSSAIARLLQEEVGTPTTGPISLGWFETGRDMHPTRHEVALLHMCFLQAEHQGAGEFFDPHKLPEGALVHHRLIIPTICERAAAARIRLKSS